MLGSNAGPVYGYIVVDQFLEWWEICQKNRCCPVIKNYWRYLWHSSTSRAFVYLPKGSRGQAHSPCATAKEKSIPSNPQPNNKTCQHCRSKPSPSSTAVPIHHDPAQGDVRHQELRDVQGRGQVHAEEGQVQLLPPAQGDAHYVHQAQAKKGMLARVPGKGGGQVHVEEGQVLCLQLAQGDDHYVRHAQAKKGLDAKVPGKGGVRVQEDVEQVRRHPPAQGDAHHRTRLFKMFFGNYRECFF